MTAKPRTRRYTANMAQYQPETQVITETNGITRQYVMTRHGAVCRTFLPGPMMVNVTLWRPGNKHPQFQGTITRDDDRYRVVDSRNQFVTTTDDYLDAEAALLPLRTRTRSHGSGQWPYEIRRELLWARQQSGAACSDCGNQLVQGTCTRPDLHWSTLVAA